MYNVGIFLATIIQSTRKYWDIPKYSLFHETISLIISQRISFQKGRTIRRNLYQKLSLQINESMTPDKVIILTDIDYQQINMSNDKISIIRNVTNNISNNLWYPNSIETLEMSFQSLQNISGIRPWTLSALKIKLYPQLYPDILLTNDKWISSRLKELRSEYHCVINDSNPRLLYQMTLSEISLFLWRLKPSGTEKLNKGFLLSQEDFL
jgi:3-methyladenine DNA glycosylase/8-oxoguanine DNA glycosylase